MNESVGFSDFSENSASSSFDDRTHGEYESSEVISEESSLEADESKAESSELPEELSLEMSEDRTHGEYESSEEVSFEEITSEDVPPEESIPEESSLEEDVFSEEPSVEVHTCNFVKASSVSANCTQKGYSVYKCSCGKTENREYVSALGHKEGSWVVITEATVSSTGLKRKSCTRCGVKLDEEVIAKLEDPDAKYYVFPSMDKEVLIEERILYYLNYFRSLDGVGKAGTLLNGKNYLFAQGRAEQISTNFSHDIDDIRKLATELEFGKYVAPYPESYYDWETDTVIYTGNMTPAYYTPGCSEALTHGYKYETSIDSLAYSVAEGCYESKDHWSYVGAETTDYITIGSFKINGEWFFCLATTDLEWASLYD